MSEPVIVTSPIEQAEATRSDAGVVIAVRDVGKMYRLYERPQDRLKQQLFWRFGKHYGRDFWALREVSFDVRRGEALGIIGRNGSGKSTLLQIIAGTLPPTLGEVQVRGRVAALLELGSGFNPLFTGRENVYLNGAILGFSREEMNNLFEEIAAFADIGDFMDQPVKTYSSGMYVRLAFAVQACVRPDVLIVDEALSVGDIFFQQKCHARMEKLLAGNTAILFVTHDMGAVQKYCERAILMDKGRPVFEGQSSEVVKRYYMMQKTPAAKRLTPQPLTVSTPGAASPDPSGRSLGVSFWPGDEAFIDFSAATVIGEGWAKCTGIALCDVNGNLCRVFRHGQRAYFYYEFEALQDLLVPYGAVVLTNNKNISVHGKATFQYQARSYPGVPKGAQVRFRQSIVLNLAPGPYTFDVVMDMMKPEDYANLEFMSIDEIRDKVIRLSHVHQAGMFNITPPAGKKISWTHFGICDLPGDCEIGLYQG